MIRAAKFQLVLLNVEQLQSHKLQPVYELFASKSTFTIGAGAGCDLVIDDANAVSGLAATLTYSRDQTREQVMVRNHGQRLDIKEIDSAIDRFTQLGKNQYHPIHALGVISIALSTDSFITFSLINGNDTTVPGSIPFSGFCQLTTIRAILMISNKADEMDALNLEVATLKEQQESYKKDIGTKVRENATLTLENKKLQQKVNTIPDLKSHCLKMQKEATIYRSAYLKYKGFHKTSVDDLSSHLMKFFPNLLLADPEETDVDSDAEHLNAKQKCSPTTSASSVTVGGGTHSSSSNRTTIPGQTQAL